MSGASVSATALTIRPLAPGWFLTQPGSASTAIVDDTILAKTPLVIELAVDDVAVAEFIALDSSQTIRVRVEARNLPRVCDESRPMTANRCPARTVVTEAVGAHIALDITGGEPRLQVMRRAGVQPAARRT